MGKLQFENDIEIVVKSETEDKTSDSEYLGDELEKFLWPQLKNWTIERLDIKKTAKIYVLAVFLSTI